MPALSGFFPCPPAVLSASHFALTRRLFQSVCVRGAQESRVFTAIFKKKKDCSGTGSLYHPLRVVTYPHRQTDRQTR